MNLTDGPWALPESFSIGQLEVSNIQVYYSYLSGLLAGLVTR